MKHRGPFYVFLAILVVACVIVVHSVLVPTILAVILGYFLFPFFRWLEPHLSSEIARASLIVFLVLVAIALPILFLVTQVAAELPHASESFDLSGIMDKLNARLDGWIGRHVPLSSSVSSYLGSLRDSLLHSARGILGVVSSAALDLMVLLYALFYFLLDGQHIWREFLLIVPLSEKQKTILVNDLEQTLTGVLYGQFFTAAALGLICGIGYWIFNVSHVPFWMFVTGLCAIVPVIGPIAVWLPLSIGHFLQGDTSGGLGLLLFCGSFAFVIDNIVKSRLIAGRTELHPLVALLGVMGGLKVFGLVGFIFGPMLLSLLMAMLRFHRDVAVLEVQVVEPTAPVQDYLEKEE